MPFQSTSHQHRKVSELEPEALDLWVAKAEGIDVRFSSTLRYWRVIGQPDDIRWLPHQDWALAGPIIERERISCVAGRDGWEAILPDGRRFSGDTPLTAALRAFVAGRFGEDLPDGLPPTT